MTDTNAMPSWAFANAVVARGKIKTYPEDFRVDEMLGFELAGSGQHLYLLIEKRDLNTQDLVQRLARQLMVHPKNISYAGLKDKLALTRQWISVNTPGDVDISGLDLPRCRILEASRHTGKLKRGAHQGNRFEIVIRELSNSGDIVSAIERVKHNGVPNYFGAQRFGRNGNNIAQAYALFAGKIRVNRHQRGLYLSAARAFLFNQVLSARVEQGSWGSGLAGEAMMLSGSNSFFKTSELDEKLQARLASFDIHPSAPLWGKGELSSSLAAYELESSLMSMHPELTRGLEDFGLRQQRRATRLVPRGMEHAWLDKQSLKVSFQLPKGSFATTVLRELITIDAVEHPG